MNILVRPLVESDLDEADRIMRVAFGTFLGLKDPTAMWDDADYTHSRWRSDPAGSLAAECDGRLAGSNFAVRWGSLAFFGPLSVRPELWDRKVGQHLIEVTMAMMDRWGVRHRGLYTFPDSPKHIAIYQRYGFWPRFLSAVMQKELHPCQHQVQYEKFSELSASAKTETVAACRELPIRSSPGSTCGARSRRWIDCGWARRSSRDADRRSRGSPLHISGGRDRGRQRRMSW